MLVGGRCIRLTGSSDVGQPLYLVLRLRPHSVESRLDRPPRPEGDVPLGLHRDGHAGERVPAGVGLGLADREGAEPAQFHAATIGERIGNGVEDRSDHRLDVSDAEMGVLLDDAGDEFGPDHGREETEP
jgi:hypothetical protein